MQSGFYAGKRIRQQVDAGGTAAKPLKPFHYRDFGSAAYLSRGRAVISVGRFRASGLIGWFAWLGIHIAFLTTLPQPARRHPDLGAGLQPGVPTGARLLDAADRRRRGRLPAASSPDATATAPTAGRRHRRREDGDADDRAAYQFLADQPPAPAGARADGLHPDGPRHPGAARGGAAVHHPGDELPRPAPQRRGRLPAGPALVDGDGGPVRHRRRHRHRPQPRVRPAVAGPDGPSGETSSASASASRRGRSSSRPSSSRSTSTAGSG